MKRLKENIAETLMFIAIMILVLGTIGSIILGGITADLSYYDYEGIRGFTMFLVCELSVVLLGLLIFAAGYAIELLCNQKEELQKQTQYMKLVSEKVLNWDNYEEYKKTIIQEEKEEKQEEIEANLPEI